jgi:hypothetical protein
MGATHNRCDKSFIRLMFLTFSLSNRLLERPVILSPREHDRLRSIAGWHLQIGESD